MTHWNAVPGMAGWTTAKGLQRLATSPDVSRIYLDMAGHAEDLQADALVHADQARAAGYTGAGVTVGILDSGMLENHADLQDRSSRSSATSIAGQLSERADTHRAAPGRAATTTATGRTSPGS